MPRTSLSANTCFFEFCELFFGGGEHVRCEAAEVGVNWPAVSRVDGVGVPVGWVRGGRL